MDPNFQMVHWEKVMMYFFRPLSLDRVRCLDGPELIATLLSKKTCTNCARRPPTENGLCRTSGTGSRTCWRPLVIRWNVARPQETSTTTPSTTSATQTSRRFLRPGARPLLVPKVSAIPMLSWVVRTVPIQRTWCRTEPETMQCTCGMSLVGINSRYERKKNNFPVSLFWITNKLK